MRRVTVLGCCLATVVALLSATVSQAADEWKAKVQIQRSPATLDPGEKGTVRVNISNAGTEDWPVNTQAVIRAIKDPRGNERLADTPFSDARKLGMVTAGTGAGAPDFQIEGGNQRGEWTLEVFVEIEGERIEGSDTCVVEVTAEYAGRFSVRKYPKKVKIGTKLVFEFDVENRGNIEWDAGEVCINCRVVSANAAGALDEGKKLFQKRFEQKANDDIVLPGDRTRFTITVASTKKPGIWKLEWQLYDLEDRELFGQKVVGTVEVTPK